jgi:hypothetical protein
MVVASPRYAPMMFDEPDVGRYVRGELYRVGDMVLAALDRLEALDLPGNIRTTLDVLPIHACVRLGLFQGTASGRASAYGLFGRLSGSSLHRPSDVVLR